MTTTTGQGVGQWLRTAVLMAAAAGQAVAGEAVVGIVAPQTGVYAELGKSMANGIVLALEQAEDSKRFHPDVALSIKLIDENQSSSTLAKRIRGFVIDEEAVLMLGPTSSLSAAVVARIANGDGFPLLSPAVSEGVTKTGYWVFRSSASPMEIIDHFAREIRRRFPQHPAMVVYPGDNPGYQAQAQRFTTLLEAEIVETSATPEALVQAAEKIRAKQSPVVIACMDAEPAAHLATLVAGQAPAMKPPQWAFCPSAAQPALLRLGGKSIEGAIIPADYLPQIPGELNQQFVASYQARFGSEPDRWAGIGFTTGLIAAEAIRQAGPAPGRKTVRMGLERTNELPVPIGTGLWRQDELRNPHYAPALFTVEQGRFVPSR